MQHIIGGVWAMNDNDQLNDTIDTVLQNLDIKHEGFFLFWIDDQQVGHITGKVPWKLVQRRVPWHKLAELINKDELASRLFAFISGLSGRK